MKILTTRAHGMIDYVAGFIILTSPWFFGFARHGVETWIPVVAGGAGLLYSAFTNYEMGIVKRISMPAHLMLDLVSGVFLAASPWLFGFAEEVYMPHLLLGIFEIGASLITQRSPSERASRHKAETTRAVH